MRRGRRCENELKIGAKILTLGLGSSLSPADIVARILVVNPGARLDESCKPIREHNRFAAESTEMVELRSRERKGEEIFIAIPLPLSRHAIGKVSRKSSVSVVGPQSNETIRWEESVEREMGGVLRKRVFSVKGLTRIHPKQGNHSASVKSYFKIGQRN